MSYTDYAAQAAEYDRLRRRAYRAAKSNAEQAAREYSYAAEYRRSCAWLTARPELWTDENSPADRERYARTCERLADTLLASSFGNTDRARWYAWAARRNDELARESAARLAAYAAEEAAAAGPEITTPCTVCAVHARLKSSAFFAARGLDWPLTEVAGHPVHKCCASEIGHLERNAAEGILAIGPDGIGRWTTNGTAIPDDCAALFAAFGIAPGLDTAATAAAHLAETRAAIARYVAAQPAQASAEEIADMRAAFGSGELVVDVLSGRETQL
jgi:hypothetical protein